MEEGGGRELDRGEVVVDWARVPVSGLGRGSAALVGPLEGSRVASKGPGRCLGGGEARWPMAVAGAAVWCCRSRGRPPCQPA